MDVVKKEEFFEQEDDLDDVPQILSWYSLRVLRNEDRCVSQIKEHIVLRNLQDKIVEVKFFKEFEVVESEEYDPHSEFLPKRGFKNTEKSTWVRLHNGNYKRLRVVERKPLSGMVFIKMVFDLDLFNMIRSWDAGYSFLGFPNPTPMSENQLNKMAAALNDQYPDLNEYAREKGYVVVDKYQISLKSEVDEQGEKENDKGVAQKEQKPNKATSSLDEAEDMWDQSNRRPLSPEEEKEAQRAKIYHDLNIQENVVTSFATDAAAEKPKIAPNKKCSFNVNDFVFIKHLGFKGIIQEINYENDKVVVGVQMFGRRQPVECKVQDIQLI